MSDTRILILEDEAITAIDLRSWFEFWGYRTPIIACSEKEAFKKVREIKPDLALIYVGLKNTNCRIKFAKKMTDNFDTAIVYITSCFDDEIIRYIRTTRPYGYISEPFEENQLKYTVENALYKRKIDKRFIASK